MSTLFISHSSADNALASELLDWLKARGYQSVFLDLDPAEGIEAGEHWEKVLYRELVSCSVVLALVTENWLASKWCFAEATHARAGGKTILGLTASRGVQPSILADTQSIDYSLDNRTAAYQRLAEALRRAIDPQGLGRWDPARPLFPGLLYFDERDAPIFFGRRRLGRAIYQKFRELQAKPPGSERLLLVFGPSGSGKSSLMRAGTLPHVHANPDAWIGLGPFRPGEGWPEPLRRNMAVLAGPDEPSALAKLHEIADQLRSEAKTPKAAILLIVDQLEEALDAKDGAENAFWLPLSRLLAPRDTPFMAIATLRSDFMGDFQKRNARNSLLFGSVPIDPMSPEDLREVIAGPCRVAGIPIEPGLVDTLVEDAGNEQALPLLALALNRLWLRYEAKQGAFTVADYRDGLGGMRGLIDREAESTLAGKGLRETAVLDAFLSLTRLVREGVLARQPAAWDMLEPEAQKTLEPFVGARLLVRYGIEKEPTAVSGATTEVVVDLIHETLLSGWQRLRDWLARPENRDFLSWREELRHKVGHWMQAGERAGLLLDGAELKEAKKWLHIKRLTLDTTEAAYIQAAIDANKISRVKLGAAAAVLMATGIGWWGWTRSDVYQIWTIERSIPEQVRIAQASSGFGNLQIGKVLRQLIFVRHDGLAIDAAREIGEPSLISQAFSEIAGALARAKEANKGLVIAERIDDVGEKAKALSEIVAVMARAGETDRALIVAEKIGDTGEKAESLILLGKVLVSGGSAEQASQVLETAAFLVKEIKDKRRRNTVLGEIADALALAGNADKGLVLAEKIDDAEEKARAVSEIALILARSGQPDQGLAVLEKIDQRLDYYKLLALPAIGEALADSGQAEKARQILKHSEAFPEEYGGVDVNLAKALGGLARALARLGQVDQALAVIGTIYSDDDFPGVKKQANTALHEVAEALVQTGQVEQGLAAAEKLDDKDYMWPKVWAIEEMAEASARAGYADKGLIAAEKIKDTGEKAWTLWKIGKVLAASGQLAQAGQVFVQAASVAQTVEYASAKIPVMKQVAIALSSIEQTEKSLDIVKKIENVAAKVNALCEIAEVLIGVRRTEQAGSVLEQAAFVSSNIENVHDKVEALQAIGKTFASAGQTAQASHALKQAVLAADKIENTQQRIETYLTIAETLRAVGDIRQAKGLLDNALRIAEGISGEKEKSRTYRDIASISAQLGEYRLARETAEKAKLAGDTLNGYMATLKYYAIEQHPELAEKLAKLEKEEPR